MGVDRYLDYKQENYWEQLSGVDHVIDTLGAAEFEHELAVLKKGGRLVSLRTGPNKAFALKNHFFGFKKLLFTLAGSKYDKAAERQGKEYRFLFVRSNGAQLQKITEIVEQQQIRPAIDSRIFSLSCQPGIGACVQRTEPRQGNHSNVKEKSSKSNCPHQGTHIPRFSGMQK